MELLIILFLVAGTAYAVKKSRAKPGSADDFKSSTANKGASPVRSSIFSFDWFLG